MEQEINDVTLNIARWWCNNDVTLNIARWWCNS